MKKKDKIISNVLSKANKFLYTKRDGSYKNKKKCIAAKKHLTSCDNDGYCNYCGEQ